MIKPAEAQAIARLPDVRYAGTWVQLFQKMEYAGVHTQLVTIFGEPGVGKSRLVREFSDALEGAVVLSGRCLPYGEGITYFPLMEAVRDAAGFDDGAAQIPVGDGHGGTQARSKSLLEAQVYVHLDRHIGGDADPLHVLALEVEHAGARDAEDGAVDQPDGRRADDVGAG